MGYAVDWTRSGEAAATALRAHQYDCVLLDLGLPDLRGETLLQGIRARTPACR